MEKRRMAEKRGERWRAGVVGFHGLIEKKKRGRGGISVCTEGQEKWGGQTDFQAKCRSIPLGEEKKVEPNGKSCCDKQQGGNKIWEKIKRVPRPRWAETRETKNEREKEGMFTRPMQKAPP